MRNLITPRLNLLGLFALLLLALAPGCATQRTFDTPDLAVKDLVDALRTNDHKELENIFGPNEGDLLSSGDPVADQNSIERFLTAYDAKHELVKDKEGDMTLVVGDNDFPLPIPLVKDIDKDGKEIWYFDTDAGKDEIINRRIGRNELDTIQTCLAICDAQREYAMNDPDHDGVPAYAQKFMSDPGKKNGLYWQTKDDEPDSPLGSLVADAQEQGYVASGKRQPYHGYYFRMLKSQGPNAKGGARDYVVGKEMLGGFATVAYPADYGSSGIMTFIINQDGVLYQRDLGDDTEKLAESMSAFDPGPEWKKVEATAPPK